MMWHEKPLRDHFAIIFTAFFIIILLKVINNCVRITHLAIALSVVSSHHHFDWLQFHLENGLALIFILNRHVQL